MPGLVAFAILTALLWAGVIMGAYMGRDVRREANRINKERKWPPK